MALSGVSSSCEVFIPCGACKAQLSVPIISVSPCSHNLHERCFKQLPSNGCPQCNEEKTKIANDQDFYEFLDKIICDFLKKKGND
jgi:hypothetical protein